MDITHSTILLTGAQRVGKAVARRLAEKKANIAFTFFTAEEEVRDIAEECQKRGSSVALFRADLSQEQDVLSLRDNVQKKFGGIDILIHMAAIYPHTPWETLRVEDWDKNINTIAKSTFLLGKHIGDVLLKNSGRPVVVNGKEVGAIKGKIITISDWSIFASPYKGYLPYNAAKAGVVGLTKSLAKELAPHILVNTIAPGPMLPPPDLTEEESAEVLSHTLLGHWGGADEIAKAVLYLIDADFVTGQVFTVDGGRTIA